MQSNKSILIYMHVYYDMRIKNYLFYNPELLGVNKNDHHFKKKNIFTWINM